MTKKEFLAEHKKYGDIELTDDEQGKLYGMPHPGATIKIQWQDEEGNDTCIDEGYMFLLPFQDDYIDDYFIHVPKPDNSAGIGDAPPEWKHINNLLKNKYVKHLIIESSKN